MLWGSKAAGPGRQRYTKITMLYPGVHPACVHNQPATFSDTLYPRRVHREQYHSDTPVSPELTFSFAPGHAV